MSNENEPRVPAGSPDGGQWTNATAYRYGSPAGKVTFYSKEKDYAEEYAIVKGGRPEHVVQEKVTLHNPIVVDAGDREFSHPMFEKPHIDRGLREGRDVVFRHDADEMYVKIKK